MSFLGPSITSTLRGYSPYSPGQHSSTDPGRYSTNSGATSQVINSERSRAVRYSIKRGAISQGVSPYSPGHHSLTDPGRYSTNSAATFQVINSERSNKSGFFLYILYSTLFINRDTQQERGFSISKIIPLKRKFGNFW
jgi:hypothetical protein